MQGNFNAASDAPQAAPESLRSTPDTLNGTSNGHSPRFDVIAWLKRAGRQADVLVWAIHDDAAAAEIYPDAWILPDPIARAILDTGREIYNTPTCDPHTPESIGERLQEKARATASNEEFQVLTKAAAAVVKLGAPTGDPRREVKRLRYEFQVIPARGAFPLDDIGNGKRFAAKYGHVLRFDRVRDTWTGYDGGIWKRAERGEQEQFAKTIEADVIAEAQVEPDDDRRRQLLKHAASLTKRATRDKMLLDAATEGDIPVTPEEFDADPRLFNVANCTLNLRTCEPQGHDPGDLLTLQSPVEFDAAADCPTWRACLARWIPDDATRDYMQDSTGVTLDGLLYDEFFNFLYGDGSNGKSTFLGVLESLLGTYSHKTQAETLTTARDKRQANSASPELLACKGARLLTVHEIDARHAFNTPLIKDVTGRDAITARGLFEKRATTFEPQFTLWMFGNGKPRIKDTSGGMWRRPRVIEFGQPIAPDERDPHLREKLEAELPGILNWALEGLRRVQRRGLVVPEKVQAAVKVYESEENIIAGFIAECCDVKDRNAETTAKDLWERWTSWCHDNSEKEGNQKTFGAELTRRGHERLHSNGKRRWKGIKIRPSTEQSP